MNEEVLQRKANKKQFSVSKTRKIYISQLVVRCVVLAACILLVIFRPEETDILQGWHFFQRFSPLHLLWGIWMMEMLFQLIPVKKRLVIALGSQKHFGIRFQPMKEAINYPALRRHIIQTTKAAYKVFAIWAAVVSVLSVLRYMDILNNIWLFMVTMAFYVCDLICVLVWCPFRLIVKAKCCTTCRIFNWDHLMMFSPMLMIGGFYSVTLVLMAFADWLIWELCIMMYPERFWENTNGALRCSNCTDKLCTQYCGNTMDNKKNSSG
ncbi:MAG: hypothetical protein MJ071_01705 [Oscillospiraceae bacterium]|nr:hypothetical protein [Oscillospiraceae bacterium]